MSSEPRPPRRTQAERSAESNRRLFRAAIELIGERGYEGATAAEIGRRAGYSRAMVHRRFGTKDALLDELMRTEYEDRIREPPPAGTTGLDRLITYVAQLETLATEDPAFLRGVFNLNFEGVHEHSGLQPRMIAWLSDLRSSLVVAYEDGVRDGSCRDGLDAEALATDMIAMGIGLAYCWIVLPDVTDFPGSLARWREQTRRSCVALAGATSGED